uniref:Uncharacterized protein n=1 Tax=Electrophorus electricus TaxID=8005 RepID=A0AAY5EYJ1_ELEEL
MPPFLNYLPHYGNPIPSGPSTQVTHTYSMLLYPAISESGSGSLVFPSQAFIKYSLPKAPGRKSVEIYYPYDFSRGQVSLSTPFLFFSQLPRILPIDYAPQTVPQQQQPRVRLL